MKYTPIIMLILCFAWFGFTRKEQKLIIKSPLAVDTINTISGTFSSYYFTGIDGLGNISTDSINVAEFYPSAVSNQTTSTVSAGDVILNTSTKLDYDGTLLRYFQNTSSSVSMKPLSWNVQGSTYIPAFTYSFTPLYPEFNPGVLPDTSTKSSGITISLGTVTNPDPTLFICTARLTQNSGAIQTIKTINQTAINNTSVFFSASDLSAFNINEDIDIIITLQNYKYATVGTQNFAFITSHYYRKQSYLK
ncbi:MAG: hypothetical protein V4580_07160 [Bacteroidota bacterium]